MLELVADPAFQTEMGQFNIEINVAPREITAGGLGEFEEAVRSSLNCADERARTDGAHLVMIGILPTLMPRHVRIDAMSANPRYAALNDQIFAARGEDIELAVDGVERLSTYTDSITPEAACTSFQLHLQVSPAQFAQYWNAAQAIAGVQLAVGANSPFLFGKQLWHETRIPLFEQATDTRPEELKEQGVRPRVWFGERWVTSVFDLFEENARYFTALLPICDDDDPVAQHDRGEVPALAELSLHNGTVYRWNRPIYAVVGARPHLRVENRVLPAGPTVVDAVANAAFYYGLVRTLAEQERPIWSQMSFSAAEENLHTGARHGLDAMLYWPGVGEVPASELVLRRLLPLAHAGLDSWGVDPAGPRPAARRHRGALHERRHGRRLADRGRPRPAAEGGRPRGRPPRDARALHPEHAQQRARTHLGALRPRNGDARAGRGVVTQPDPALVLAGCAASTQSRSPLRRVHDLCEDGDERDTLCFYAYGFESSREGRACASTRTWSRPRRRRWCSRSWPRARATATRSSNGCASSRGVSSSGPTGCSTRCCTAWGGSDTSRRSGGPRPRAVVAGTTCSPTTAARRSRNSNGNG